MDDPLIQSHLDDMAIVYDAVPYGRSLGWESPGSPAELLCRRAERVEHLPKMIQMVLLQDVPAEEAAAWGKAQIIELQADFRRTEGRLRVGSGGGSAEMRSTRPARTCIARRTNGPEGAARVETRRVRSLPA